MLIVYWYSLWGFNDAMHLLRSGLNTVVDNLHRHWLRRGQRSSITSRTRGTGKAHTHIRTRMNTHTNMHALTQARICTHMHKHTHAQTHVCPCARAHTHTQQQLIHVECSALDVDEHARTHTHTHSPRTECSTGSVRRR